MDKKLVKLKDSLEKILEAYTDAFEIDINVNDIYVKNIEEDDNEYCVEFVIKKEPYIYENGVVYFDKEGNYVDMEVYV